MASRRLHLRALGADLLAGSAGSLEAAFVVREPELRVAAQPLEVSLVQGLSASARRRPAGQLRAGGQCNFQDPDLAGDSPAPAQLRDAQALPAADAVPSQHLFFLITGLPNQKRWNLSSIYP